LAKVIHRFEEEYPETRLEPEKQSRAESPDFVDISPTTSRTEQDPAVADEILFSDDAGVEDDNEQELVQSISRRNSEVSLASRALADEEGRMLRLGQRIKRDFLIPQVPDHLHKTTGYEPEESEHLQMLRSKLENLEGYEIRDKVNEVGIDGTLKEIGMTAEEFMQLMKQDPTAFERFQQAKGFMEWNAKETRNLARSRENSAGSADAEKVEQNGKAEKK
jgi:hypothetical protein